MIGIIGLVMVKMDPSDVPPPGAGVVTIIVAAPTVSKSAARVARRRVGLSYWVGSVVPPHNATEPGLKLDPLSVSVISMLPAWTDVGFREVSTGTGFWTVNVCRSVLFPPKPGVSGFSTLTVSVPALVKNEGGMVAVIWVPDSHVAGMVVPLTWTSVWVRALLLPIPQAPPL